MHDLQFIQRCHSQGRLLVGETLEFLRLMAGAFGRSGWIDRRGDRVRLTHRDIEQMLEAEIKSLGEFDRFGINWVGKAADNQLPPILIYIGMGGSQWCPNDFSVDFSNTNELPDLSYFRRSIELIRPFEASIHSTRHHYELVDRLPAMPPSDIPKLVYWFHYLSGEIAEHFGGVSHCLATPAYKCEPFLDGVLIQLTEEPFDPANLKHREIQWKAMEHLGLTRMYEQATPRVDDGTSARLTAFIQRAVQCPRCGKRAVRELRIKATGEVVHRCSECNALWPQGVPVSAESYVEFSSYIQQLGLWDYCEVEPL